MPSIVLVEEILKSKFRPLEPFRKLQITFVVSLKLGIMRIRSYRVPTYLETPIYIIFIIEFTFRLSIHFILA